MTEKELLGILKEESNSLDWKKGGDPENIVETLAAFANDYEEVGGGSVLCGIEEQKKPDGTITPGICGITNGADKKLEDRIFGLSRQRVHPPILPQFDRVALSADRVVLVARITASNELHFWDNKVTIRRRDRTISASTREHSELVLRKANLHWLDQPCPGATANDINFFALEEITKRHKHDGGAREYLDPAF